jgi:hypothetical protein
VKSPSLVRYLKGLDRTSAKKVQGKKEEGRRKREEGRRKKEEGRRKREEGRGKKEEGGGESFFDLRSCTNVIKPFMNRLWGLFHNQIHSLWNGHASPLLTLVQDLSLILHLAPFLISLSRAGSSAQPLLPTTKLILCGTGRKACSYSKSFNLSSSPKILMTCLISCVLSFLTIKVTLPSLTTTTSSKPMVTMTSFSSAA